MRAFPLFVYFCPIPTHSKLGDLIAIAQYIKDNMLALSFSWRELISRLTYPQISLLSEIVTEITDIYDFIAIIWISLFYGGDPLSHLPIGQESMEVKNVFYSVTPALKGFIINRFI